MMINLEHIKPHNWINGIVYDQPVKVLVVEWVDSNNITLTYQQTDGEIAQTTLSRDDENRLVVEQQGQNWSFDADGEFLRLVTEAERIALAHHFDPYLAIHTSLIEPLPHQITAVYGEMLSRQPLRFLLADDPGAGKTIMSGLLIKELKARGDLERCLVVAPGNLVEQWQDELGEKFDLEFEILTRDMINSTRSSNPFDKKNYLIARLDMLARDKNLQDFLIQSTEYDLIICDEAHRMSASYFGGEIKFTKRHRLGQLLSKHCRHFLLMTATPHNGKEQDFQLFMALLDEDRLEGRFRDGGKQSNLTDMMRRLTKEELLRFNGRPLFPDRQAYTVKYQLSSDESHLYNAVTNYVRNEMNRVERFAENDGRRRNNVGFALQILQRRLASSPEAIYQSLKRRRERLEGELIENPAPKNISKVTLSDDELLDLEELRQDEIDDLEGKLVVGATMAETVEQLRQEVDTLKSLEKQALGVLHSGQDAKWTQLSEILDNDLMVDANGNRRKLIVFTEARDTLNYLSNKIKSRLGRLDAVAVIHGSVAREERRRVVEKFMQDRSLLVLVANDAAGEGVNLQRGHLMVNYDLPWNPNKIEQRFGRIHRIGQTEVCHLWNLVAEGTREGEVYARLLEKLETARKALGGRVYDVLGELFEGTALKDLLVEAIQRGDSEEVKSKLFQKIDGVVDQEYLLSLLKRRALTNDTMPETDVEELRQKMERADAQRLQPSHVQSFFIGAFEHLGGRLKEREKGRWEVTFIPPSVQERDQYFEFGAGIQRRYERICFEKNQINLQPVAAFIHPKHPLLLAVINIVRQKYGKLMEQGATYVDDTDFSETLSVVVLIEHDVQDGRKHVRGQPNIISKRLQFVALDPDGIVSNAGLAPHLNLRPADDTEKSLVNDLLEESWLKEDMEKRAINYATIEMAQEHLKDVKERRIPAIEKTKREVDFRLKKEINYYDTQAYQIRNEERARKNPRLTIENAERRASELYKRLKRRMALLEQEKHITSRPPRVRGAMLIIPRGLLSARGFTESNSAPTDFCANPIARREVEILAMESVMEAERHLGNNPIDVSIEKVGYDIESHDPINRKSRFIEVKGRVSEAKSVTVSRQEIITSLNKPDQFILALVEIHNGSAGKPRYVNGALDSRNPPFDQKSIQFDLNKLLERAKDPS